MTKKIVISAIAASVMATSVMATNGTNLVGFGTKSRAMGGASIAAANGAESGIDNPAMIAGAKQEVSASLLVFMPDVSIDDATSTTQTSASDQFFIPTIAYVKPINKELTVGVTLYGASGLGVDYSDASNLALMETGLSIAKITVPVAYKVTNELTVGVSPVLAYGSLRMAYNNGAAFDQESTDTTFTYELGAAYQATKELNVAFVYKAATSLSYDGVLSAAMAGFGVNGVADDLEQPAETGLGLSYKMGASTINADYRMVAWADAAGYKTFGWEDQAIMSIGYEYATANWAARVGYSTADQSPIQPSTAAADALTNTLNGLGFPATITTHMTFGGAYNVSKTMTVDAAVVLGSEEAFDAGSVVAMGESNTAHSQTSFQIGLSSKF